MKGLQGMVVTVIGLAILAGSLGTARAEDPSLNRDRWPSFRHFADADEYGRCQKWMEDVGWAAADGAVLGEIFHMAIGREYRVSSSLGFNFSTTNRFRFGITF